MKATYAVYLQYSSVFFETPNLFSSSLTTLCFSINSIILSRFLLNLRSFRTYDHLLQNSFTTRSSIRFYDSDKGLGGPLDSTWAFGEDDADSLKDSGEWSSGSRVGRMDLE